MPGEPYYNPEIGKLMRRKVCKCTAPIKRKERAFERCAEKQYSDKMKNLIKTKE